MHGYHQKVLRIDLATASYSIEEIAGEVFCLVLGGKGLGTYLLLRYASPGMDPLDPANPLIFTTGPIADTVVPGGSRYGVFTKSPLTGFYAESYSGGRVAPVMKGTGYDAIIIQGRSPAPVFIEISPERIKFHPATHLWGLDTYQTEDAVLAEVGEKKAQAVVIGPAGEKLVRFACIENNYWRSAGRCGVGAVMGAKNLKAVVFWGEQMATIADPELLHTYVQELRKRARRDPGVKNYQALGTPQLVALTNAVGCFPSYYWSRGRHPEWKQISGETLVEVYRPKSRACKGCFIACGKLTKITTGPYQGLTIEGPEYETIYAFGGLCGIASLAEIAYLNDLCDRWGMDTITAGNLVALAIEASRRDRLAFAIDYGDTAKIAELLSLISQRQGIGEILADGIIAASRAWGLEDLAVHVKGLEPAGYDPRVLKGMGLSYAVSPRGACHLRSTFYKAELSGMIPKEIVEGKAAKVVEWEDRLGIFDALILCRFFRDLILWDDLSTIIKAVTGFSLDYSGLRAVAGRIVDLTRIFNLREGLTKADDYLPPRLFAEPLDSASLTLGEFEQMLSDYYTARGWDAQGRVTLSPELRSLTSPAPQ